MQPVPGIPTIADFETVFGNVVSVSLAFAGIILFIMLVIGGVKYITSGGDAKSTDGAQKTITYAIGGLILILLSYMFLVFIQTLTGVDLQHFKVTQ